MGNIFSWWGNNSSTSDDSRFTKIEQEISNLKKSMSAKVDKVSGKSLSTNDFTDDYKGKVDIASNDIAKINDAIEKINENGTAILVNNDNQSAQEKDVDYVTPQMFGAAGDGWTDDTKSIQKAIDSGKSIYLPHGEYRITEPLIITDKSFWNFHGSDAVITYTGTGYALRILNAMHCRIELGLVNALNGGGVEFYSDSIKSWNQYVTLVFEAIKCATDCIHVETTAEGWCNENRIHGGRFLAGENGFHAVSRSAHTINGWKFYDCGIEGVNTGFWFDATEVEETAICNMTVLNPRYGESFEKILKTNGLVIDCQWIAPTHVTANILDCSAQTTRFEILSPIGDYWHMHDTAFVRGFIMDGKLMGEKPEYKIVE